MPVISGNHHRRTQAAPGIAHAVASTMERVILTAADRARGGNVLLEPIR